MRTNFETIKKKLKKVQNNLKHNLNRKEARRTLSLLALVLLIALSTGFTIRNTQAQRRARVIEQKHIELNDIKQNLERLEKQKANTEYELNLKLESETFLKQQVEQLNKDLQTKRSTQAQLANAKPANASRALKLKVAISQPLSKPAVPIIRRGGGGPNLYTRGQCTWHVKNLRPDIPNSWGNASSWYVRARAMGWPTGTSPRVGAIGQRDNHVVYVTAVHGNGTITISEMNYNYVPYAKRTKIDNASRYRYIY